MGRKGGGRAGFLKASRRPDEDGEDEVVEDQPPAATAETATKAAAKESTTDKPAISAKAAAFLKDPPPQTAAPPAAASTKTKPAADSDDDDSDAEEGKSAGGESRGQMLQRHKRETKALKDQIKRLGKKAKDETAKLESEMEKRHAEELASLNTNKTKTAGEVVAVAASLYSVTLDGAEKKEAGGGGKKQSKAQKRREQKLKEEAEREARIAAEQAELGETERMAEERELNGLLKPKGLAVFDIPPDGHCLYRSLEHQLSAQEDGGSSCLSAAATDAYCDSEDGLSFLTLRQVAAEFMRTHADDFLPFITQGDINEGGEGEDQFERYCTEIENTPAWGGQLELQALSKALKVHIEVFSVGLPTLELGEEYKGTRPTLQVCYLRHAYGLGEHYNSVLVAKEGDEDEEEQAASSEEEEEEEE